MKFIFTLVIPFLVTGALDASAHPRMCSALLNYLKINWGRTVNRPKFDKNHFYWRFPSDHLPAAARARLNASGERFPILTWNVLNQAYLPYMLTKENTQGLKVSEITAPGDRSDRVIDIFSEFMGHIKPAVVGLQEVDPAVLQKLRLWSQANGYGLLVAENPLTGSSGVTVDHGVILFDEQRFVLQPESVEQIPFVTDRGPTKYIQKVELTSRMGISFIFVNVHRDFLDKTVFNHFVQQATSAPTVLVGDLNLEPSGVDEILKSPGLYTRMKKGSQDFTHINTKRDLADYDHILFSGALVVEDAPRLSLLARKRFQIESESL